MAMVLQDRLVTDGWHVEIVASDLSTAALARAHEGVWPVARLAAVPQPYLKRYFLRGVASEAGKAKVGPLVRSMVDFCHINLSDDTYPLTCTFDAIFCRNALIYFDTASRAHVLDRLIQRLAPGGFLFLGHAESLIGTGHRLRSVMPAVYRLPPPARTRRS